MNAWVATDYKLGGLQPIASAVTNQAISKTFGITAGGANHMVVAIKASGVTAVGTLTVKLQSGVDGTFQDSKTVTVSGNGYVFIKLNVEVTGDQTYLPLLTTGQVVITTTNAADRITIDSCNVIQEL